MPDPVTILERYLPEGTASYAWDWLKEHNAKLKVSRPRKSKLGDYRPDPKGNSHRISVNADLNKYAFMITLVHEMAHLETYVKYGRSVKPHGREWKKAFGSLMSEFRQLTELPTDLSVALNQYMDDPSASSCADLGLSRALRQYDQKDDSELVTVESLKMGESFVWRTGREFTLETKLRKRYRCKEKGTNKLYLFSPLAEVLPVKA